jgi:hypothetical protein
MDELKEVNDHAENVTEEEVSTMLKRMKTQR